ncbi:MAG: hypothetical protein M3X11_12395, partial [Acidobacteriota bacterium]|nr:hypothetical protein [Acidobacteriota bacterium]
ELESLRNVLHKNGREKMEMNCREAIERLGKEYAALKARQEEEAIVAKVETWRVQDASLAACREWTASVQLTLDEELAAASDKTRRKVSAIQQQINRRIASCEEWIAALPERIAAAEDVVQFKELRDEIIRRTADYANTLEGASLLTCQKQVEARAEELAEAEQRQAVRQAQINAHFGLVNERATRVVQARAFADAVREFAYLQPLPALPDGVLLVAEEEREQQTQLEQAQQRIIELFKELTAAQKPSTVTEFERRQAQLERSLETLEAVPELPAEWRQQLLELAQANSRAHEDWQVKQRQQEESLRLAQENERRQSNNRKLVDGALKQAKGAQSLREIKNAIASLNTARAAMEPPCEEQDEQFEEALRDLKEREETICGWVNEILPAQLSSVWAVSEVQELRRKIVSYESRCEGEAQIAATLNQARLQLDERGGFLNELAALEKNVASISHCHEKLTQLEELRERYPDGERMTAEASARLREKLARLHAEQRTQAERWLEQFDIAMERELAAKEAGALLRKLQERPAGLEERDEPFLEQVSARLNMMIDRDKVARIVENFRTLQTAEQRAECLLQMAELCRADGMPEVLAGRLAALFEMGATI